MTNEFDVSTKASRDLAFKSVTHDVSEMVKEQGYVVPEGYSVANAVQGALMVIANDPNLAKSNPESISKALFDMVVQGLSATKTQVYFIKYGNNLSMQRSYFGTQAVLKRLPEIKDIAAYVVHEGDQFDVDFNEAGQMVVTKHETQFANLDNDIIGAYAVITKTDGEKQYEVMTKKMIDASWSQAKSKNVQQKFPEEMAKRTVINRAAKNIINTTGADDVLVGSINKTTANEYDNEPMDVTPPREEQKRTSLTELAGVDNMSIAVDAETVSHVTPIEPQQESIFENISDPDVPNPFDEAGTANE